MGQSSTPIALRVGINYQHAIVSYASGEAYAENLHQDLRIRNFVIKSVVKLGAAILSKVRIERLANKLKVIIYSARPGAITSKRECIAGIKECAEKISGAEVYVNIVEIKRGESDANTVAQKIANALENRMSFKRVCKKSLQEAIKSGALGVRIEVSGRLNGAEIARMERFQDGSVPRQTLRAKIDYALAEAHTIYGIIGVKIWVHLRDRRNSEEFSSGHEVSGHKAHGDSQIGDRRDGANNRKKRR